MTDEEFDRALYPPAYEDGVQEGKRQQAKEVRVALSAYLFQISNLKVQLEHLSEAVSEMYYELSDSEEF